jgi:hypothetical protein
VLFIVSGSKLIECKQPLRVSSPSEPHRYSPMKEKKQTRNKIIIKIHDANIVVLDPLGLF